MGTDVGCNVHEVAMPSRSSRSGRGGVVAVGWYDGLHRGHRRALEHLRRVADERGVGAGLVLLDDDRDERRLTSVGQRVELLADSGLVDTVWVVTAPVQYWSGHAPGFIRDVLLVHTEATAVLTTTGDTQGPLVQGFGQQLLAVARDGDLTVIPLDDAHAEWEFIDRHTSSTEVAHRLDAGDVAGAAVLLGRHHQMHGTVELGDQRGRTLGFPTANVGLPVSFVIPAEGVYAGTVTIEDRRSVPAAISLGRRPTFYPDGLALLEAHLIDFDGDLYGQRVVVSFVDRLRDQRRFSGPDELVAQLRDDVAAARRIVQR